MRFLFIGNSHTYFNDLPHMVCSRAEESGFPTEVTMIAHGGWYLKQHVEEPDMKFNIKYGHYDYVVLQEHSHPFDRLEDYEEAVKTLSAWIKEAGSVPVIYGTWSQKAEPQEQERMNETNRRLSQTYGTLYAPVGESWWSHQASCPEVEMYASDGANASPAGSEFAAMIIWETIRAHAHLKLSTPAHAHLKLSTLARAHIKLSADKRSFILGMITAFCECVAGGCKRLALSPPLRPVDFDDIRDEAYRLIENHGLIHYHERNLDMPEDQRFEWILIAAKDETIDEYLRICETGNSPARSLKPFFGVLSYNQKEAVHSGYDAYREYFPEG